MHVAQVNVSRPLEPLDSARLRDFVRALEPVNASADRADGFLWRLQTEDGDATGVRVLDDDRLIVNLTVWRDLESLRAWAYGDPLHLEVLRRRREWFPRLETSLALWWVPEGTEPAVAEAERRIRHLAAHGPTPYAFTFRAVHGPDPDAAPVDLGEACPA